MNYLYSSRIQGNYKSGLELWDTESGCHGNSVQKGHSVQKGQGCYDGPGLITISEDESDVTEISKLPNDNDDTVTKETDTMVTKQTDTMVTNKLLTVTQNASKDSDDSASGHKMSKCNGAFSLDNSEEYREKEHIAASYDSHGYIGKTTYLPYERLT